jgi:hypothetical protein
MSNKGTYTMAKVTLRIEHDSDAENPTSFDSWKPYSFSPRHSNHKSPEDLGLFPLSIGMRRKLKTGTAFLLSYFEHGNSLWMLKNGTTPAGVEFRWDGIRCAGLLVWEDTPKNLGAKTYADRTKDAQNFLDTYNAWCNGSCFGYSIDGADGEDYGSCWGFYESDYMLSEIEEALQGHTVVALKGDATWIAKGIISVANQDKDEEDLADATITL